ERRREDLPTADQATGTVYKPTAEFYNIDLFVKAPPKPGEAEGTWSRIILSEDQQADLLSSATSMAFSAPQIAQLLSATPPIALRPDQITALQGGSTSLLLTPEEAQALIAYAQANPSSPFLTAIQLSQLQLYTAGPTAPGSLQNDIQHYFDQTYTTFGASSRLDAAVEYARRTYLQPGQTAPNLVPGETGIRHGLMLIAQPGLPVAVTYGTTTTGDEVVAFNANTGSHLISGGWYSFNDASLAAYRPQQAMGGLSRYYVPSYRLSEQFPQLSGAQDRFLSMSLLGIDRYRATVLGGWKTQGGAITNAIGGGEFATRDFNAASFLNFDQSGSIVEGLVSAGGRVGAVDFTGYAYRPPAGVSSYGDEQGAIASIRLSKDATLTFYGQGSAAPIRNPAWSPAVMRPLAADIKSLHDDIAATTPLDMLKPASWNATMRDFMTRSGGLAARTFGQSFDDLFFANWIAALSAGYVDKTTDVKMTWGLTNNGSFLSAMSDFDKNVAIVAGMRITDQATPAPEVVTDSYNPYLWMAGLKWKPKNFAFGFYTAQALDQQTIGTIQAGVPDVITAAVSRSISTTSAAQSQFWLAGMQIGPEKSMGIVNYSISPDLQDVELGARFAMSSDFYLAAAYQNLKFFQKPGQAQGAMTKADFDAAQQLLGAQGMMPDNIASQGLKFDLRYQMGANAWLSGTGSMRFMDKGPYDWYAGIRISAAP
ncbi:MAG: hypothetical protein KGH63_02915, partial [Candidatus Micrarchaeota archaeon]|nr:hypothetical protein [Candidatus Micrarchaeota archaeon]